MQCGSQIWDQSRWIWSIPSKFAKFIYHFLCPYAKWSNWWLLLNFKESKTGKHPILTLWSFCSEFVCTHCIWYSQHELIFSLKPAGTSIVDIVDWEPEGHCHFSMMFCWEPEEHHCSTKSMAITPFWFSMEHWACSQRNESRSESRFGTWFGPFPDLKAWFYPLWTQSSFKSGFWNAFWNAKKRGVLDRDSRRKPDSEACERKALSERDSLLCEQAHRWTALTPFWLSTEDIKIHALVISEWSVIDHLLTKIGSDNLQN